MRVNKYYYKNILLGESSSDILDNHYLIYKDKINWSTVANVIRNCKYFNSVYGSRIDTKEGYTIINSQTENEYLQLKNFNVALLGLSLDDENLSIDDKRTLNKIYNFVIPTMIKHCETYFSKEFDLLYS